MLEVHGGMGRWGGWGTFVLFAVLKGLHMAVFATLAGLLMRTSWAIPLTIPAVAALWTGIERTHGSLGFAWLDLGNAGIDMPADAPGAVHRRVRIVVRLRDARVCGRAGRAAPAAARARMATRDRCSYSSCRRLPQAEQGPDHALLVQPNVDTGDGVDDGVTGGRRTSPRDFLAKRAIVVHHLARSARAVLSRRGRIPRVCGRHRAREPRLSPVRRRRVQRIAVRR